MDKQKKSEDKSDESVEEEIEEVISSESLGLSSSNEAEALKVENLSVRRRQLFDVEDDDHFMFDDNQLSGKNLVEHFKVNTDLDTSDESKKKSQDASKGNVVGHKGEGDGPSTTNQSTANDVSDLADEVSEEPTKTQLVTRSLDLSNNSNISYERRECSSLETAVKLLKLPYHGAGNNTDSSVEQDHSFEEVVESNASLEKTLDDRNLSSLGPDVDINDESLMNKLLSDTTKEVHMSLPLDEPISVPTESSDDIGGLRQKILSLTPVARSSGPQLEKGISFEQTEDQGIIVKQMERVQSDFSKEILEDITEESEKNSNAQDKTSQDFDSIVSLNMMQMIENDGKENSFDCGQRRDYYSNNEFRDSLKELPPSGRDSCSLATSSTEYRIIMEDLGTRFYDHNTELARRDHLIEDLKTALEQSNQKQDQLQNQIEKFANEIQQLRKHLPYENNDKSNWLQDHESTGQRLSEISLDLVSESDDDLNRQLLTDEEKVTVSSRNSRERQFVDSTGNIFDTYEPEFVPVSKHIEQFQKFLKPSEVRIFFMIQKKFDDFLCEEIEKTRMKCEGEMKSLMEQLEVEKRERELEINRLQQLLTTVKTGSTELVQLRQELDAIHAREMEDLRTYFEKKCSDLEKQYSEEVFSQKSQRNSNETSSDFSDQDNFPEEATFGSREGSPRKRTREQLYSSPSHRQITPTTISQLKSDRSNVDSLVNRKTREIEPEITVEELEAFYREKIRELNQNHDAVVKKLTTKLKKFETNIAVGELMKNETNTTIEEDDLVDDEPATDIEGEEADVNESQEIRKIAAEYDRRLQEQVALAKQDIIQELESHIQALLSESTSDDHHWPPELILLREKFTAKSQLEIAQLQIKHEEEMSRLKADFEKQMNRKSKRNSTFDLSRDLDQIVSDRENFRQLSNILRDLLSNQAKYMSTYEDDCNALLSEFQQNFDSSVRDLDGLENNSSNNVNSSTISNQIFQTTLSRRRSLSLDNSGILSVIEDPKFVEYIAHDNSEISSFDLRNCLDKLRAEANLLLQLSEKIVKKRTEVVKEFSVEKNDSGEEEDGLKTGVNRSPQKKILRSSSFSEDYLTENKARVQRNILWSLPPDLNRTQFCTESIIESGELPSSGSASELNFHVNELKNRLMKSESDRKKLQDELKLTINKNVELGLELNALREQLEDLDSRREDYSEGYGLGELKSPPRQKAAKKITSFSQLQEKARNILSTPTKVTENSSVLIQIIEDFCREGDKVVEEGKKDKEDLQAQIDAADKQLKDTRQFLEDQAVERELERDEYLKEIEILKSQLREKEKERTSLEIASKEAEQMEQQIKELNEHISAMEAKNDKLEIELKASIDRIFVLREIISGLETKLETRSLSDHVLTEKVKELEAFIAAQNHANESLQNELEHLKSELGQGYEEKVALEEQLRNTRSTAEQSSMLGQITEQLRDIEATLDQKIKNLELLHQSVSSISCSTSPAEDVSMQGQLKLMPPSITPQGSPVHPSPKHLSLPIAEVQRVFDKLAKHTRVEEAAVKRIKDLEMLTANVKTACAELQNERDVLQERMSEQLSRISSLQSKLEEQRRRAEDIQRHGTTDLNIRIHDLQNEVFNLKETLSARDKQIANLKKNLEQSKVIMDRQEAELSLNIHGDRSAMEKLECDLKARVEENKRLKEKIKHEMINKLALPDLMETMLADKNEEIDHLREQLDIKEKELQGVLAINLNDNNSDDKDKMKDDAEGKHSARTLSDIVSISEYDEPDVVRRAAPVDNETPLVLPSSSLPENTAESGKLPSANVTEIPAKRLIIESFEQPYYLQCGSGKADASSTPTLIPRQINFSEIETKSRESKTSKTNGHFENDEIENLKLNLEVAESKIGSLKISLENVESEKNSKIEQLNSDLEAKIKLNEELASENNSLEDKLKEFSEILSASNDSKQELAKKTIELAQLHEELRKHQTESKELRDTLLLKDAEIAELNTKLHKAISDNQEHAEKIAMISRNVEDIDSLRKEIDTLNNLVKEKDESLTKQEKNLLNLQQNEKSHLTRIGELETKVQNLLNAGKNIDNNEELDFVRAELSHKLILYEKCLLDIRSYQEEISKLKESVKEKDNIISNISANSKKLQDAVALIQDQFSNADYLTELNNKLKIEQEHNLELEGKISSLEEEIARLRSQSSDNSKPYSLDEIAAQIEKELNYSAQLDNNILKAIESEEEVDLMTDNQKLIERDLQNQIQNLKAQLEAEKLNSSKIQELLTQEKQQSQEIQEQDAKIIGAMRLRLEDALKKEQDILKLLDAERDKCDRLVTQISVLQRAEARKSSMLLRSPPDSPRKSPRSSDSESEVAERFKTEIKLLKAQNEREKERVIDLQRALEKEKNRFDTELSERIEYADRLKLEMDKISREKDSVEQDNDHLQERLTLASREIESLEKRISALQESETRRAHRRDRERTETVQNAVELDELKSAMISLKADRDHLNQTISILRADIERGAQREAKLAEALANSGGESSIPEQFLQKMKEMNKILTENTKENRQMIETIQVLIEERRTLQKKIEELEADNQGSNSVGLEERANHLFGKYLRVESHRKALVHQKRYLLIVLRGYEESEAKTLAALGGFNTMPKSNKKNLFKTVAIAIIAIQRMKFIVRRWHNGRRIVQKSIFNIPVQKRPNNPSSFSPPCRDVSQGQVRPFSLVDPPLKPLQTPALISECTQKFDWSRLKK